MVKIILKKNFALPPSYMPLHVLHGKKTPLTTSPACFYHDRKEISGRLPKAPGYPLLLRHKAALQSLQRGIRFYPWRGGDTA
ncbi:hypothetical protein [Foetidibacter luteolus]|uniref:hypothetical protein n=1 Tax=Foetidibacter luteolus TaxID=2608880 RepID=UPI00129AE686|nr:hypothetical protein [Foetidibacter luteolus]